MPCRRRLMLFGAAISVLATSTSSAGQDPPDKVLKGKGLRKKGSYLYVLPGERELSNALRRRRPAGKISPVQAELRDVTRRQEQAEARLEQVERDADSLIEQRRRVHQDVQAADRDGASVDVRNRLITTYNDVSDRLNQVGREHERIAEGLPRLREDVAEARERYLQTLLDVRDLVDKTLERYDVLKKDPAVKAALDTLNDGRAGKRQITLGPSPTFTRDVQKLAGLEKQILSETIELRARHGVFSLEAIINGKHHVPMVLDTGAALICLPSAVAKRVGLKASTTDPTIKLQLADGRMVKAGIVRLKSLRVGKFKVDDVPCALLPRSMSEAPPLLGQSFLRHFTYRIDSDGRKLTLRKFEIPTDEPQPPAKSKAKRRRR